MKVSVIIPVYNAAPFLEKSIQSALVQKQTGEVLLIDDRSTDNSLEICKRWERKDSRVKVFVNDGTRGAGAARNVGIRHATYEYIAFLDADDYYIDHAFKNINLDFQKHPDADAVIYTTLLQSINGKEVKTPSGHFENNQIIGPKSANKIMSINTYLKNDMFFIQGLLIKKNVINKIGFFDTSLLQTQDTDFILRLLQACKCYSSNNLSPICVYFLHENNRINQFDEALFYRKILYKKHFILSLKKFYFKQSLLFFRFYAENSYLLDFSKTNFSKVIVKVILLPYFIFQIFRNEN